MGVKLQEIVHRKEIPLSNLSRSIIAMDAPNIIFSLLGFSRKEGTELITDRTQRVISHLYGLLYRIIFYYSKNIYPLFCFDGRDSELKHKITKDQLNDFLVVKRWYQEAIQEGNKEKARRFAFGSDFFWRNTLQESKKLLGAMGVPFIESPSSAESQCAYLVKRKVANYCNSQDFDALLFGCPKIIQNLSKSLRRKIQGRWQYSKITPLEINLPHNLSALNLNQFQLIDVGILIGTDYFPGIKGIGAKTALRLIQSYKSIEAIPQDVRQKYDFSQLTSDLLLKVRKIFLFPEVNENIPDLYWDRPDEERIIHLLCEDHTLNKERVKNNVEKLVKNYKNARKQFLSPKIIVKKVQKTLF